MEREPGEIELLLPWHAAGTLSARDCRRVREALAGDPELARQYRLVREECAETIDLNESLGAPSVRTMQKLFAAIDAEPARKPRSLPKLGSRLAAFLATLSPRALAWSAGLGATMLVLQTVIIATVLSAGRPAAVDTAPFGTAAFETASWSVNEPVTRDLGRINGDRAGQTGLRSATSPHALVRFAPDARIDDITALLDKYQASIIDGARGGMFRLRFAAAMSKDEFSNQLSRLQTEKIVSGVAKPSGDQHARKAD